MLTTSDKSAAFFHHPDLARLLLRITCGGLLLMHGLNSAINGIDHIKEMVSRVGLPDFVAYGNLVGEVVAPLFLVVGYKARIAALIIAFNMFMSVVIAHRDIVLARNDFGGLMIELNAFYFMTALVVFFSGSGKYSISGGRGMWD